LKIPEGRLKLENLPDKAVVKVDGVIKSETDLVFDMKNVDEKSVKLVITADGYRAEVVDIELEKGATITYRAEAKRIQDAAETTVSRDTSTSNSATVKSKNSNSRLTDYPALRTYVESLRSIPAGTFQMGSSSGDSTQKPVHSVTLSAFRMGATPVTVSVWKEYCAATGTVLPEDPSWGLLDSHPVVNVSWNDIMGVDGKGGFCAWASDISGFRLTLPTEAQWEYAARGAVDGQEFPWGNSFDRSKLWCSLKDFGDAGKTAPVVRSSNIYRNSFGLTDMVGNVWQWCSDLYGPYTGTEETNPVGPPSTSDNLRCVRGGSWSYINPVNFRCANRLGVSPDDWGSYFGFRLSAGPK
jgi:formylglycine-generating enzyme required for sulfatase activity